MRLDATPGIPIPNAEPIGKGIWVPLILCTTGARREPLRHKGFVPESKTGFVLPTRRPVLARQATRLPGPWAHRDHPATNVPKARDPRAPAQHGSRVEPRG